MAAEGAGGMAGGSEQQGGLKMTAEMERIDE